ncbi:hypothetical protein [Flavobacterium aciduliphilum]|jgi:hypothetical protein|uniref:Uncharacterized protein n=1 Tax=Flavobacterium aciduliphilum TaxID=1101402 RepID=A0A328YQP4_9FLAO|nr:hypothetical protein [Flavobacterium aciduliphilum]RAR72857.1 hypothetical protein CLV55_104117 [Flavobacterium aciduliphilum]
MKLFKYIFILFFVSVGIQKTNAQTYTFRTSSLSIMDKTEKGAWNNWSEFKKAEIIITLDAKKDRFVVNSKDIQLYRIESYLQKVVDADNETLGFNCIDNDGAKCIIMIVTRKKENNRKQFYIIYPDLKMVYNIYKS